MTFSPGGVNFLIPADAQVSGEALLTTKALAVQSVPSVLQGSGNRTDFDSFRVARLRR
jgi:hypothetical protein